MWRLWWLLLTSSIMSNDVGAQTAKIVGTGAATCATFLSDIARNPISEREYFSWAQGYMSCILMRSPPGKDENLDLTARVSGQNAARVFSQFLRSAPARRLRRCCRIFVPTSARLCAEMILSGTRNANAMLEA
jgi:hypothetical protein